MEFRVERVVNENIHRHNCARLMPSSAVKFSLAFTLFVALVPYLRLALTRSHLVVNKIAPVCLESWPDKSEPPIRLCLSCLDGSEDSGGPVWVTDTCDTSIGSQLERAIKQIECEPSQRDDRQKRIVAQQTSVLLC